MKLVHAEAEKNIKNAVENRRGREMEFFRKYQKIIIMIIILAFVFWTISMMVMPILFR